MTEAAENNVVTMKPEAGPVVIKLEEADAKEIAEGAGKISTLYAEIGQTHVLYERAMKRLTGALEEAEKEYGLLGRSLAKKYVKDRGHYNLDPEIGAFIGMKAPQGE